MKDTVGAWAVQIIALLQIVGSGVGIWNAVAALVNPLDEHGTVAVLAAMVIFTYGIVAGFVLWSGNRRGCRLSRIFQALQLPLWSSPNLSYRLGVGYFAYLKSGADGIQFEHASTLAVSWELVLGVPQPPSHFGVNVVALTALMVLEYRLSVLRRGFDDVDAAGA